MASFQWTRAKDGSLRLESDSKLVRVQADIRRMSTKEGHYWTTFHAGTLKTGRAFESEGVAREWVNRTATLVGVKTEDSIGVEYTLPLEFFDLQSVSFKLQPEEDTTGKVWRSVHTNNPILFFKGGSFFTRSGVCIARSPTADSIGVAVLGTRLLMFAGAIPDGYERRAFIPTEVVDSPPAFGPAREGNPIIWARKLLGHKNSEVSFCRLGDGTYQPRYHFYSQYLSILSGATPVREVAREICEMTIALSGFELGLNENTYSNGTRNFVESLKAVGFWGAAMARAGVSLSIVASRSAALQEPVTPEPEMMSTINATTPDSAPGALSQTAGVLLDAIQDATAIKVVTKLEEVVIKRVTEKLKDRRLYPQDKMAAELSDRALLLGVPLIAHYLCVTYSERIPQVDKVKAVCEYAIRGNALKNIDILIEIVLPMLGDLAELHSVIEGGLPGLLSSSLKSAQEEVREADASARKTSEASHG